MVKNIIWDFDGTLFNTYPAIARSFLGALKDFGCQCPLEKITVLSRSSMDHCIAELCKMFGLDQENYTDHFIAHYSKVDPADQPPFAGVRELCDFIKAKGGKNFIVTHRGKEGALALLEYYAMAHLFVDCIFGDEGYPKKPDPAVFNLLIKKHHLKLDETLAVGDRDLDIEAGQSAGIITCLFSNAEDISHKPDMAVTDFHALLSEIRKY